MDTTVADPLVGRVLDGRYRIESRIARGGMATVYTARDIRLDREIAIKVMHGHLAADEDFVRRFIGEAKAAAALSHPNVVAVYDQRTDGEHVFLVMEYVPGRTLRDLLTERGRLGPRAALEIMQPVLAALGAAHRAGLVHRDVKPENVLITADGQVKVADFGLARAESDSKMTKTGLIIGTVGYLAPEQVLAGDVDIRSDVYAAGVMLFELLTGRQPHQGDSALSVAYKHVNETVPAPSTAVPGLPPQVDALVTRATAHDPARRPQDANRYLAAVAEVYNGLPRDFDQRLAAQAAQPRNVTAVLESPPAAPPAGGTRVMDRGAAPGGPGPYGDVPPPERTAADRFIGAITGKYVLIAIGAIAAVILGWAVWYQTSGQYEHVPDRIVGTRLAAATKTLQDKGLVVRRGTSVYSDRAPKGTVARTDPPPGTRVAKGATITLVPSRGRTPVAVPDVAGKTEAEARQALKDKGFSVGDVSRQGSQTVDKDKVVRTRPAAGAKQSPDEPVDLVVSTGMSMPDLRGMNADTAADKLRAMGLDLKITKRDDSAQPPDTVLEQSPAPGTGVSGGDEVSLVVNKKDCLIGDFFCKDSSDQNKIPVPGVLGQPIDQAVQAIQNSGFTVKVRTNIGGKVVGQLPLPGTTADRGSEITIWG
ncbi:Stk1 family PASTA domain-containing Ser/Thr kinase [Actinomadura parmotrematis]|uniref:non-specific serine/threonine protein kinase n=1 Tax=Actinomadura parmotrematis TaxID=2864039 RepID=A0ABS7FKK7_9ACTN|nr:Stk1 family PASTA domain-containing Ser/Thr kinase [Actinomadura parmotrematis]MBW8480891.1 Stk1 family PASTA domain-containing Ser/Thr kinase [Actinomadura parmotrematis]